jgi:hypothetical protein
MSVLLAPLLLLPEKGKFLPLAWGATSAWTQQVVIDAMTMGPKADVEALDLGPQRELDHAEAAVLEAALGRAFSARVADKLHPSAGKSVLKVLQQVASKSTVIAVKFSTYEEATKALYFSSSIFMVPLPTSKSLKIAQNSGKNLPTIESMMIDRSSI